MGKEKEEEAGKKERKKDRQKERKKERKKEKGEEKNLFYAKTTKRRNTLSGLPACDMLKTCQCTY